MTKISIVEFVRYSLLVESVTTSVEKFRKSNPNFTLPDNIEMIIQNIDPTGEKGTYADWLLRMVKLFIAAKPNTVTDKGLFFRYYNEDLPKLAKPLKTFDDLKAERYNAINKQYNIGKDINVFKVYKEEGVIYNAQDRDLIETMAQVNLGDLAGIKSKKEKNQSFKQPAEGEGKDLVAENSTYKVYKVTNLTIATEIGKRTWQLDQPGHGWCTENTSMARHYLSMGPLFIYEDAKSGEPFAQLHTQSNQFKDVNDAEIDDFTPELIDIFKQLVSKDDGIAIWCEDKHIQGLPRVNVNELALRSPEGAYGYLMTEHGRRPITPEISAMLQRSVHLSGYYIQNVCRDERSYEGRTDKKYSDQLTRKLIGFPPESIFADKVLRTGDPTLASRIAACFSSETQEKFLQLALKRKNPVALVEIACALKRRLDEDSEILIMNSTDIENWKKYSSEVGVKIGPADVQERIKANRPDEVIEAYLKVLPLNAIQNIYSKTGSTQFNDIREYFEAHPETEQKLLTNPDWAYSYAVGIIESM